MKNERAVVQRLPERGKYDAVTIRQILDASFLCHVAFDAEHGPVVLPTLFGRDGDRIYLHGSTGVQMLRNMKREAPVSVAVTLVDGIVAARSLFHHSINYRSVVIFGIAEDVTDVKEKLHGSEVLVNHILPGRWDGARHPNTREFIQALLLKLDLKEASEKVRTGPLNDVAEDLAMDVWAGVIPISTFVEDPVDAPDLGAGVAVSLSVLAARQRWSGR